MEDLIRHQICLRCLTICGLQALIYFTVFYRYLLGIYPYLFIESAHRENVRKICYFDNCKGLIICSILILLFTLFEHSYIRLTWNRNAWGRNVWLDNFCGSCSSVGSDSDIVAYGDNCLRFKNLINKIRKFYKRDSCTQQSERSVGNLPASFFSVR